MQSMADAARWESYLGKLGKGDPAAARSAARFARAALSTPKGVVSYASTLTFGMPGQAAHGWYLRIDDTDQYANALARALGTARTTVDWKSLARTGIDMALAQADAVPASARIPDDAAARLHFPVTPPSVRHRTIQTAVATTLEALATAAVPPRADRSFATFRRDAAALARDIRAGARPGAGPATPEVIVVRWRRLRTRLAGLPGALPR